MKTKAIILSTLLAMSATSMAQGGFQDGNKTPEAPKGKPEMRKHFQPGGFYDESKVVRTAQDALNAADDTPVLIEGHITKQVDKNDFIFKDANGTEIQIEVNRKAWKGQTITPNDKIEIRGEVDKDWGKTEIEVKQITKK
ncbi:hypothetical protein BMT54_09380 [Pasteurellaceae bacterium 15-036681]|nr:hypothetical protein BMT54_09380 [Pasteurellaceae bacterium 15-036681]